MNINGLSSLDRFQSLGPKLFEGIPHVLQLSVLSGVLSM
jgi:hypothetical protein